MLTETFLDRTSIWLLYIGTAVVLLLGSEIGYRLGVWRKSRRAEADKTPTNAIMGSILGLLAFLLAFTFGMANSRFDSRRQLVLDEASAVLKTYQRVQLLPEAQRLEASRLLREYTDIRIRLADLESVEEIRPAIAESERIQNALWEQAATMAERPNTILSGFMQSLTELTDLQMKRVRAAVWNRIPPPILLTLYTIAFLGLTMMGYGAGLVEGRAMVPSMVLVLAFSAAIVLIVDLERPRQQLFEISHEPMIAVAQRMAADSSPAP